MYLNDFDIIVGGIILFLSIKGFLNGASKEIFSFIGFVVGIFIATRFNIDVGNFINTQIFPIDKEGTIKLLGFISIFILILLGSSILSNIFSISNSNPKIFSRIVGYLLSISKYLIIFSMIIVGVQHSDFLDKKLKKYYKDSQIILYSHDIGFIILNIEKTTDKKVTNSDDTIANGIKTIKKNIDNIKEDLEDKLINTSI